MDKNDNDNDNDNDTENTMAELIDKLFADPSLGTTKTGANPIQGVQLDFSTDLLTVALEFTPENAPQMIAKTFDLIGESMVKLRMLANNHRGSTEMFGIDSIVNGRYRSEDERKKLVNGFVVDALIDVLLLQYPKPDVVDNLQKFVGLITSYFNLLTVMGAFWDEGIEVDS